MLQDGGLLLRDQVTHGARSRNRDHDRRPGRLDLMKVDAQDVTGLGVLDVHGPRCGIGDAPVKLLKRIGRALELTAEAVMRRQQQLFALLGAHDRRNVRRECEERLVSSQIRCHWCNLLVSDEPIEQSRISGARLVRTLSRTMLGSHEWQTQLLPADDAFGSPYQNDDHEYGHGELREPIHLEVDHS